MPSENEPTLSVERPGLIQDADPLIGYTISGRYDITAKLGSGGFGTVYLACDRKLLSKQVVVKILTHNTANSTWSRKKFKQELEALSRIDHPSVVVPLDSGELPDRTPFLVMQYIDGTSLKEEIPVGGADFAFVATVLKQLGAALAVAHARGVVHRDLKPANIMIQRMDHDEVLVRVIDFGVASVSGSRFGDGSDSAHIAGTPRYMAPEQSRGKPEPASDTYAMGVVAYELLTGRNPFVNANATNLYALQEQENFTPPALLRIDLPPQADEMIRRALCFDPRSRSASPREFGFQLGRLLEAGVESTGGREPHLGRLVARLCDRRTQEDDFRLFLQTHFIRRERTPLVIVIKGEEGECHQSLVDRLVYQADRFLSQRDVGRLGVVRKRFPWQYDGTFEQRRNRMLCRLLDEVSGAARYADISAQSLTEILDQSSSTFLVVEHEIHLARWDCHAGPLLQNYLEFWAQLGHRTAGAQPLIFLSVIKPRYQGGSAARSWLGRWTALSFLRPAAAQKAEEDADKILAAGHLSHRLVLDELQPIVREDVLEWFSLNSIYDSEAARLSKIREMFPAASARWPMAEVERHLARIHDDFIRERGYR